MSAEVQSASTTRLDPERWDLLPDKEPIREGAMPLVPTSVVQVRPWLRRTAISSTTDLDALRRIIRAELRLQEPRQEVIAMCNQQMARVKHLGLDGGDQ